MRVELAILMLAAALPRAQAYPEGRLSTEPGLVNSEFIFESAPFRSCHASTLAETTNGLVAAWFGGTDEGNRDVTIWCSRLQNGAWSTPVSVASGAGFDSEPLPCWNPVLFQAPGGPLLLFYKAGPSPSKWWGMLKTSTNCGVTWGEARRLPDGIVGPIKNKPVLLPNGTLLCGSSTEGSDGWRVHFEWTRDLGQTWERSQPVNDGRRLAAIQPSLLLPGSGSVEAIGRTKQGRIFMTQSSDSGKSWSETKLLELPNPNSGIDAVTLRDRRHLLVYNHITRGRSPINVAVSKDGAAWQAALVLEHEPGAEFSYPAVIQTADGQVHITYTWKRKRIKHTILDPDLLEPRDIIEGRWPDLSIPR
jgi:predicted neuraminidase